MLIFIRRMFMLNKTLPLALCMGLSLTSASVASISNNDVPEVRGRVALSVGELQGQNDALRQRLADMQVMLQAFSEEMASQQQLLESLAALPQNPDPKVVEKAVVREVLRLAHIPADDLSDDESGKGDQPPAGHQVSYVQNNPALLARLRSIDSQMNTWSDTAAMAHRIHELEGEMGILMARQEEERKKLEKQRLEQEELVRRMQLEQEQKAAETRGLTNQLSKLSGLYEESNEANQRLKRQIAQLQAQRDANEHSNQVNSKPAFSYK
jgi:hypothetical protein